MKPHPTALLGTLKFAKFNSKSGRLNAGPAPLGQQGWQVSSTGTKWAGVFSSPFGCP